MNTHYLPNWCIYVSIRFTNTCIVDHCLFSGGLAFCVWVNSILYTGAFYIRVAIWKPTQWLRIQNTNTRWAHVVRSTCGTRNKNIGVALAATMLGTGHYLRGGGATKWEAEVLPLRKGGGGGKSCSHAEGGGGGGHNKFWGSFYVVA